MFLNCGGEAGVPGASPHKHVNAIQKEPGLMMEVP